jgi:hypothetical protein
MRLTDIEWVPEPAGLGVALPSGESASDFIAGKPGATGRLIFHYLGRSAIVGAGLFLVGVRGKELVKYSLVAAGAIEVFVLGYAFTKRGETA